MAIIAYLLLVCSEPAGTPVGYPVEDIRVVDGDTFVGTIILPWNVALYQVRIRAADYDAWETTRRRRTVAITNEELEKGRLATEAIREALTSGTLFATPSTDARDRYGRILAILFIETQGKRQKLSDWMRSRGYIRGNADPIREEVER